MPVVVESLRDVIRVARAWRQVLEHWVHTNPQEDYEEDLGGLCGLASEGLVILCNTSKLVVASGYFEEWYQGHAWVQWRPDNMIVDITATQFRIPNRVHVTPTTDPQYVHQRVSTPVWLFQQNDEVTRDIWLAAQSMLAAPQNTGLLQRGDYNEA